MQEKIKQIEYLRRGVGLASIGLRISPERCTQCLQIIGQFPDENLATAEAVMKTMRALAVHASPKTGLQALAEVTKVRNDLVERYGQRDNETIVNEMVECILEDGESDDSPDRGMAPSM